MILVCGCCLLDDMCVVIIRFFRLVLLFVDTPEHGLVE